MFKLKIFTALALTLSMVCLHQAVSSETSSNAAYFFVQMAETGQFDGNTLTLNNISPVVAYFSGTPTRIAGHMQTSVFLDGWEGDNFKKDPPNALVTLFWDNATIGVIVELSEPVLDGNTLKYNVKVLEGSFPKDFRIVSVFFDPLESYEDAIH